MKRCARCKRNKPVSKFGPQKCSRTGKIRADAWCRQCRVEYREEKRRQLRSTPEGLAQDRAVRARWQREWRKRYPERDRQIRLAAWDRLRNDPVRYAAYLDNCRIDSRLRRERAGQTTRPVKNWHRQYEYLDPAPLVAIADQLEIDEAAAPALARAVRRLRTGESRHVEFNVVDALAIHVGLLIEDIYPELAA